jgi:hypothetical protein
VSVNISPATVKLPEESIVVKLVPEFAVSILSLFVESV